MIPPWFQRALSECESLALDVASDRARLWSRVRRNMPEHAIEVAIDGTVTPGLSDVDHDRHVATIHAAVMTALTEA